MTASVPQPLPYFLMEQIRRGIITGRYGPGAALREQKLEIEYGTSRGPLREALRLLELRGLVTHEPRRGFRVREYSAQMVEQIYRLRGLLERHTVEALAGKPLEALIVKLTAANGKMAGHFASKNIEAYLEANVEFHEAILHTADNEPLQRSIASLNEMAQPIRYALLASQFNRSRAIGEHEQIIMHISAGDLKRAAAAIEAHIIGNIDVVTRLYGEGAPGDPGGE
jgi:DNA-binding GntR family transcriptional regulator